MKFAGKIIYEIENYKIRPDVVAIAVSAIVFVKNCDVGLVDLS